MKRVKACEAAAFLVCEVDHRVVGLTRGVYDGSRAINHLLSVHPSHQGQGFGAALVQETVKRLGEKGMPTASATVTDESLRFWQQVGLRKTKAFLVGNW